MTTALNTDESGQNGTNTDLTNSTTTLTGLTGNVTLPGMTGQTAYVAGDPVGTFTADDLAKAREQEKNKLYPELTRMKDELAEIKRRSDEAEAAQALQLAAQQAALEAQKKALEEEELSAKELLAKREQEWNERLEHETQERERAFALLEKDREYQEIQNYLRNRLSEESDNIVPELLDLVGGSTADEVEQSIAVMKEKSAQIMMSAQQASTLARQQMTGARVTAPVSGPLDTNSEYNQLTSDAIKDMPMSEFAKLRPKLFSNTNNRGQGLFDR